MVIGACKVVLFIPDNQSLKGKRHVIKSIVQRVRNTFNVSIAEVEDQDLWQKSTLGVSCVSNDARHVNEVLSKVVEFIENSHTEAQLYDYEIEIVNAL
ncbi:MAG: DUF503 domain-containing protein [Dehalococcoidia bacterium]|nr:DUF503 domain-containing protein [Dehalococcoidia bacterium]